MTRATTNDDPRQQLLAWLWTDEAMAAARSELHRLGLDLLEPHDLLNDVAVGLLTAELTATIDNPVGYARRSLRLQAIDRFRGERVRAHEPLPDLFDDTLDDDDDGASPGDAAVAGALEDGIRRSLFVSLHGTKTWVVAAALNTVTLRMHPDVQLPDSAPRPDGGAPRGQEDRWAALWLAGERDCFDAGDAARQARSRKLRQVDRLLAAVAEGVLDA